MQLNSRNDAAYFPNFSGLLGYLLFILKSADKQQNALLFYIVLFNLKMQL